MESVEKSIVVNVPSATAYEQWARVEDFPRFLKSVREVRRIDENHFDWRVERSGQEYESVFQIMLRIPDHRIAWRTLSGAESSGVVCSEMECGGKSRVTLKMKYVPDAGWHDPSVLSERLESHLRHFKEFIEALATEKVSRQDIDLSHPKAA